MNHPLETHWVHRLRQLPALAGLANLAVAAQGANTLCPKVTGCARSWRDRDLQKAHLGSFYLALTLQTFLLLLLAADSNPPLRADPSSICALLVRAGSRYPTLLSRLVERTSARRSCTLTTAWAAKKESCCSVGCAGTMRIVRPLLFENSSLPAVEVSRKLASGRATLCARITSGLPLP